MLDYVVSRSISSDIDTIPPCQGVTEELEFEGELELEGARSWGSLGAALGQFDDPAGVVVMSTGAVWVVDRGHHRLCLLH